MKTKDSLRYLEIYQMGWIHGYGTKGKAIGDPMCEGDFLPIGGKGVLKRIREKVSKA